MNEQSGTLPFSVGLGELPFRVDPFDRATENDHVALVSKNYYKCIHFYIQMATKTFFFQHNIFEYLIFACVFSLKNGTEG